MKPIVLQPSSSRNLERFTAILGSETPRKLALIGNLDLLSKPTVGFCGSRKATQAGLEAAKECAEEAARAGLVVVSGYASGVDEEAHGAALRSGGATIVVLSEGIARFRIKKVFRPHWDWSRVLIISQWDDQSVWRSYQAMARNKTIIGLSNAMVVIEAGLNGGTQHAGETSLKLGVPLFVLEYREMSEDRAGNALLIRAGGVSIRKSRDTGRPSLNGLIERAKENFLSGAAQRSLAFRQPGQ